MCSNYLPPWECLLPFPTGACPPYPEDCASVPQADCGSDYELLIAKFRHKLKKVGKTTRPLRYDLNQIPYNYTVIVEIDLKDWV